VPADRPFTVIDGFRCFAPELALASPDYPAEGFEISASAEAASFWCRSRNRIIGDAIARFTDPSRPIAVLEIGSGIGGVIAGLRRFAHLRLIASEVAIDGLRFARARFPDVEWIQLDATAMPFTCDFDLVGAFDVLEHIEHDEQALAGVHRALRPSGIALVTVPQHPWMWSALDDAVRHKRRYTRRELLRKLDACGLETVFVSSFVTALFPVMAAARLLARRRRGGDAERVLSSEVMLPPLINGVCDRVMRIDEAAMRRGVSLPFGGSLLAVARKR